MFVWLRAAPLLLAAALALPGLLARPACAGRAPAPSPAAVAEAKRHFQRGLGHFRAAEYDRAREEFLAAYALSRRTALLYNLAITEQRLGDHAAAIDHLTLYLQSRDIPDRAEAEALLAELQQRAPQRPPPDPAHPSVTRVVLQPAGDAAPIERPPGRGLTIAKWTVGAVGVAGLVAGGALLGLDGTQDCGAAPQQCPQVLDTRGAGIGGLVGGAALLGASAVLFVLDYRQRRPRPAVALAGPR